MKSPLAFACLLGVASVAAAQERRQIPSREFVVKIQSNEAPAFKELWVSRDGGKSWKTARDASVSASWGEWADGTIRCALRVPEDGAYDFYAQLGDSVTNRHPEPRSGEPADPKLRCDVREQEQIAWQSPAGPATWTAGEEVTLRWSASGGDLKERSMKLLYTPDGERWLTIVEGLESSGTHKWIVPSGDAPKFRLKAVARTRDGREVTVETATLTIRSTARPQIAKARALYDRARVLHAQSRTVEAELKYQEALAAWPEFGEVFNDLGKLHAEKKESAKALEYFLKAQRLCPSDPTPYVNAGRVRLEVGLKDDALADIKDAAELGLDKDERTAVLAGEILLSIARRAADDQDTKRVREACDLILKIRLASRTTQARARQLLEWLKNR
jgi:Tfp pilus assembly protein PilF